MSHGLVQHEPPPPPRRKDEVAEAIDRLNAQRVELCRIAWDEKYKVEHQFNPEVAYIALIPGEQLDQGLCAELYEITNRLVGLQQEFDARA